MLESKWVCKKVSHGIDTFDSVLFCYFWYAIEALVVVVVVAVLIGRGRAVAWSRAQGATVQGLEIFRWIPLDSFQFIKHIFKKNDIIQLDRTGEPVGIRRLASNTTKDDLNLTHLRPKIEKQQQQQQQQQPPIGIYRWCSRESENLGEWASLREQDGPRSPWQTKKKLTNNDSKKNKQKEQINQKKN